MKTTLKAKIIIETDKWHGICDYSSEKEEVTLNKIKEHINSNGCDVEWINAEFQPNSEPTIILKI